MKDHISFSQVNMYLRCGEQYRQRYIEGKKLPPSGVLIRGRCSHKAEEKNFIQKIKSEKDVSVEEVKDLFSDEWTTAKHEIAWSPEELKGDSIKTAMGKVKDSGIRLIEVFHREQAPLSQPVHVEKHLEIEFEGDFPKLVTILDRIDKGLTGNCIAEMKFVNKSPTADDIFNDLQLTIEDFAYRQEFGAPPEKLIKQWAVNTKVAKTVRQEAPPRDMEKIKRLLYRLQVVIESIRKGLFVPAPQGVWWCSPRFCGYWNLCKFRP